MVGSAQAGTAHAYRSSLMQAAAAASHLVARLQEDGRLHRAASAGRRTCRAAASSRAGSAWLAADGLRSAEVCCRQSCAEGALPDARPPPVPRRARPRAASAFARPRPASCVLPCIVHGLSIGETDLSMAQLAWHVPVKMRSPGTSVKSRLHVECQVAWDAPCSVCAVVVHVCVCVRVRARACARE